MIYTERQITIKKGESKINTPIVLYRGDREVDIIFTVVDAQFKFKSNGGNIINSSQASYGQLAIQNPDGSDLFTQIAPCDQGRVVLRITEEMIDEIKEVGLYNFHIRFFNDDKTSRITLPPVMGGIDIREPLVIEGSSNPGQPDTPEPEQPDTPPAAVAKMWIGYLPYDPAGIVGIDSLDVIGAGLTKKYIDGAVQGGTLKEVNVSTYGKTSVGLAPESAYVCCIYPANKNYTVTIDNGFGGKEVISDKYGDYPVNGQLLAEQVDGVQYKVSGFLATMSAERFLYVN